MPTLSSSNVTTQELVALESAQTAIPAGDLRETISGITNDLRNGDAVFVFAAHDTLTSSQAAAILGVSRPHLYKILDSGALACSVVGKRDRRIAVVDLFEYREKLVGARKTAAVLFADLDDSKNAMLDEMD